MSTVFTVGENISAGAGLLCFRWAVTFFICFGFMVFKAVSSLESRRKVSFKSVEERFFLSFHVHKLCLAGHGQGSPRPVLTWYNAAMHVYNYIDLLFCIIFRCSEKIGRWNMHTSPSPSRRCCHPPTRSYAMTTRSWSRPWRERVSNTSLSWTAHFPVLFSYFVPFPFLYSIFILDNNKKAQGKNELTPTEDILNSILPPREWTEDGQLWVQYVSSTPATRSDVITLQEQMDQKLQQRQVSIAVTFNSSVYFLYSSPPLPKCICPNLAAALKTLLAPCLPLFFSLWLNISKLQPRREKLAFAPFEKSCMPSVLTSWFVRWA